MSQIHELLDVSDEEYTSLIELVSSALTQSLSEPTPIAIKAAAIKKVFLIQDHHSYDPNTCAIVGMMVEQAYNAAVLQSTKKPLFKKR